MTELVADEAAVSEAIHGSAHPGRTRRDDASEAATAAETAGTDETGSGQPVGSGDATEADDAAGEGA